jgi:hypothetical protein
MKKPFPPKAPVKPGKPAPGKVAKGKKPPPPMMPYKAGGKVKKPMC